MATINSVGSENDTERYDLRLPEIDEGMTEDKHNVTPWLTMTDICKLTGMSENTVRKYRREGLLPMAKIGGKWKTTYEQFKRAERAIFERRGRHQN